jgi:hypothetical protein
MELENTQSQIMEETKTKKKQMDTKLFGIVVKRDIPVNMDEETKMEERKKHFLSKEIILDALREIYKEYTLMEYVIAHEHGAEDHGCHYQCCVQLDKPLRTRVTEYKKTIDETDVYICYQTGKKGLGAIAAYCKKDGDYICSDNVKNAVQKTLMERLVACKNQKEQIKIIQKELPKDIVKMDVSRMLQNVETVKAIMDDEPIKITFPEYLIDREPMLFEWYCKEVVGYPTDYKGRRKALVLFSKERAMGKTTFAKMLVSNNDKAYVICRNNFNAMDFVKPNAQLLILDDMTFVGKQTEMWKALVSSEKTAIRDAYCNVDFGHGMATVVTTNNYSMFTYMMGSDYFKYECYFYWVKEFLGPEGTNPRSGHRKVRTNFNMEELEKKYGPTVKVIHLDSESEGSNHYINN